MILFEKVTEETCEILQTFGYTFEQRGLVAVKGKGQLMTYYLKVMQKVQGYSRSNEHHNVLFYQFAGKSWSTSSETVTFLTNRWKIGGNETKWNIKSIGIYRSESDEEGFAVAAEKPNNHIASTIAKHR